jgi:hypothetical protein
MASHNSYPGYVKLPQRPLYKETVRLDFNANIRSKPGDTKLEGFALRLFVLKKGPKDQQPEIAIHLRPEEFIDLADAMKAEFESAQRAHKRIDDLNQ